MATTCLSPLLPTQQKLFQCYNQKKKETTAEYLSRLHFQFQLKLTNTESILINNSIVCPVRFNFALFGFVSIFGLFYKIGVFQSNHNRCTAKSRKFKNSPNVVFVFSPLSILNVVVYSINVVCIELCLSVRHTHTNARYTQQKSFVAMASSFRKS